MDYSNKVLVLKTAQTAAIKCVFSSLKDILVESQLTFRPDGWRLADMATGFIVHMFLDAANFESFYCKYPSIVIGVKTLHLFKLLSFIEPTDVLTISVEESDYNNGVADFLTLQYENATIMQCKTFRLKLQDAHKDCIELPNISYTSITNLPSADFHKIIRYLNGLMVTTLEFNVVGSELILRGEGPYMQSEIRRGEMENGLSHINRIAPGKVVQGYFSMPHLMYIIKCTSLSPQMELYMANDMPLIVQYSVSTLGKIRFALDSHRTEQQLLIR